MKGRTSMKARLGIATAVVVGGGAIGVAAVAAGSHSGTTNAQSSAFGYTLNFHHTMSEGAALSAALTQWSGSHQKAMTTLAEMQSMRTFSQVWTGSHRHRVQLAAQRGVVVLATKKFLVVQSANNPSGTLHLWWLKGTSFANVSNNATGMVAMTGNNTAGFQAMANNNMAPAQAAVVGSTVVAQQMAAPVAKPTTITIATGTETISITITPSTATVTTPASTAPTTTATTPPAPVKTTQPVFSKVDGVVKGDMVFVTGERVHGQLVAKLVLFAASTTTTTTPTATPSVSTSVAPTSTTTVTPTTGTTPTTAPSVAPSGVSGTHS